MILIKKKDVAKLIDTLNSLSFIAGLFVYFKTNSVSTGIIVTVTLILLIQFVRFALVWHKNHMLKKSGIHDVDQMEGHVFEEYLAVLFKARGYTVQVTKATGDFGADLILIKNGVKTVVQAKRYSSNVGIKAVQEIIGAINYYKADQSMVITELTKEKAHTFRGGITVSSTWAPPCGVS